MDIQHTAKDFDLTDAIRDHAEEKLTKACSQIENLPAVRVHVTYRTVGHGQHGDNRGIHVLVFVPHGEPLQAEEASDNLYGAIDQAAKDVERQVKRYRDKMASHRA